MPTYSFCMTQSKSAYRFHQKSMPASHMMKVCIAKEEQSPLRLHIPVLHDRHLMPLRSENCHCATAIVPAILPLTEVCIIEMRPHHLQQVDSTLDIHTLSLFHCIQPAKADNAASRITSFSEIQIEPLIYEAVARVCVCVP
jgi:hypothetical protein